MFGRCRIMKTKPARRAKPNGTPKHIPTPMATWLLLDHVLEEGVTTVAADEGGSSDDADHT